MMRVPPENLRSERTGAPLGRRVLRYLLETGRLSESAAAQVEAATGFGDRAVGGALVELGLVGEEDLALACQAVGGVVRLTERDLPPDPALPESGPAPGTAFFQHNRVWPVHISETAVTLAMADPTDDFAAQAVGLRLQRAVIRVFAPAGALDGVMRRQQQDAPGEDGTDALDASQLQASAQDGPAIKFVNGMIARASDLNASDIHISVVEGTVLIRYRIDGVLRAEAPPPAAVAAAIVPRLKIMARLDIGEQRLPQDGRAQMLSRGRPIDLRISTMPTVNGEGAVVRLLERRQTAADFATLGFSEQAAARQREFLTRPHGILLVTGPTGSGKTTTLYTMLEQLNAPDRHIVTVEDPVEYRIPGISQIQAHPAIGLTFARALRSILRQDPDIVMVGEIRDQETAQIAIQAALTGHLVLATLHTNDAASAVVRLMDMGIESYLIASALIGVTAQRLVRKLCPDCRRPAPAPQAAPDDPPFFEAVGCAACDGAGYRGRMVVSEALPVSPALSAEIARGADLAALRALARQEGMTPLMADGLAKAASGLTSLSEVMRVAGDGGGDM